jgi:hypothetical protein
MSEDLNACVIDNGAMQEESTQSRAILGGSKELSYALMV